MGPCSLHRTHNWSLFSMRSTFNRCSHRCSHRMQYPHIRDVMLDNLFGDLLQQITCCHRRVTQNELSSQGNEVADATLYLDDSRRDRVIKARREVVNLIVFGLVHVVLLLCFYTIYLTVFYYSSTIYNYCQLFG